MSRRTLGVFQMLLSGVCFGFLGVFGKRAYERGVAPGELLATRFLVAAPILFLLLPFLRPGALRLGARTTTAALVLGVLGYAVFASFYFEALSGLSASLTVMLLYAYPILVTLGARVFFGEQVSARGWAALPLVSLGLVFLVWGDVRITSPGFLIYGILSAVFYALYILASRRWLAGTDSLGAAAWIQGGAGIALGLVHFRDPSRLGWVLSHAWQPILGLALVSTIAAMSLFLMGLQKLRSSEAAILSAAEPITAFLAAAWLLGERLGGLQIFGALLVLGAMALVAQGRKMRGSLGKSST